MFSLTPVVRLLLLLNIVVMVLQLQDIVPYDMFALHLFSSPLFRPWQLVTHMFMHGGWPHLISNMLSLFFFGSALEQHWGSYRLLLFYLVCGMGAALCYNGVRAWEVQQIAEEAGQIALRPGVNLDQLRDLLATLRDSPMIGASGAVFGILFAFGYLFPNTYLYIYFAVPVKAKYFVFLYGAYELWSGVQRAQGDNVAHFAHLGGMLFAFLLLKYWERFPESDYD